MMSGPRRRRPVRNEFLLIVALLAAIAITAFFAFRSARSFSGLRGDVAVEPWMSVPYIARTHHVAPEIIYTAAGLPPDSTDQRPLGSIARAQGRPVGTLIADVEQAIAHARAAPPTHGASP